MSSINIEQESGFFSHSSLVEVPLSRSVAYDDSVLVHGFDVLPSVLVTVHSEVTILTIWAWLIAVDLSVVEQVGVVVAVGAVLHLIVGVGAFDWVGNGEDGSVISLLWVGQVGVPLISGLVLFLVASSVVPSHSMILNKFPSY